MWRLWVWLLSMAAMGGVMAQQLELFTAGQGASVALQKARQDGFADAELWWVLYAGEVPAGIPFRPTFDLSSGRANLWVYAVHSPGRDSVVFYAVVKLPLVGFQALAIPNIPSPPGLLGQSLPPQWMDSNEMVAVLQGNQVYAEFRQQYPDSLPDFVALGMGIPPGETGMVPLWTMVFLGSAEDPNTSMTCMAWSSAGGQGSQCLRSPAEVAEGGTEGVRLFPQPAWGWVQLELPLHLCSRALVGSLYDVLGRQVGQWRWSAGVCQPRLVLPHLSGVYRLVLSDGSQHVSVPLVLLP